MQNVLPAGLMTADYEFFTIVDQVYFIHNGETKQIKELPYFVANEFINVINSEAKTKAILENWFPNQPQKQLEKFIGCRFGGIDEKPDFFASTKTVGCGDHWNCPNRKFCLGDGIICQPLTYNGKVITSIEREMIKLLMTNDTNEVVAEKLGLAFGTFHKIKKQLYEKLNCQAKHILTQIAYKLNIL